MDKRQALRYAALLDIALLGIAIAQTCRAAAAPQPAASAPQPVEPPFCGKTCTRPHGEIVECQLRWDHDGFHMGPADGVPDYTWPDKDSNQPDDDPVSCACDSSLLQADIVQSADELWKWRIFDSGCDGKHRLFAIGASEDLHEAREDVVDTMRLLADNGGYAMGQPAHVVTHHVAAPLQFVGERS